MSPPRSAWRRRSPQIFEQLVAGGVAERVVDLLEVVEVEERDDRGLAAGQRLGDPLLEQRAVRQAGQRVLEGEPAQVAVALAAAAGAVEQRQSASSARPPSAAITAIVPIHDIRSLRSASRWLRSAAARRPVADQLEVDALVEAAARSKSRARISANSSTISGW